MKVLHLIDPGSPGGGACTLQLLAEAVDRLRSVDSDVLVIGNRAHRDLAYRCGVPVTGVLSPPINHTTLYLEPSNSRCLEYSTTQEIQ